ncbi:hypothetical protein FSP39_005449 [Pinctada imbricata]|uniref:C2H2-type domain-containing protein n=1 Tax=Pinctada imbricata TaxID=66713 RepID=A0AA89BY32_PINIB|nr:hypothetical protein FSP39_005449 [Pinctada imbricata]
MQESFGGASAPHPVRMNGYASSYMPKGSNARSFAFRKRFERIDWRKLASIDIEHIARTLDFNALQENIMNITFCNIEGELDTRMVDPNFIKLFKLAQLTIEYLLHSQEYLTTVVTGMEEKIKKEEQEHNDTKKLLEKTKQDLSDCKKESHKRKKLLMAQQQLIHAGSGSYNKCPFCPKAFLNSSFLQSHINRRHTDYSQYAASAGQVPGVSPGAQSSEEVKLAAESVTQQQSQAAPVTPRQTLPQPKTETVHVREEDKKEIEKVKEIFMRELKELNEKYQASERAMSEMEQRYGTKRSNLGELQDDTDNERELLRQQREEVAVLKEQLQSQIHNVEAKMSEKMTKQERMWQKKMARLKQKEEEGKVQASAAAASPHSTTPRGVQPSGIEVPTKLKMEPSDDEDDDTVGAGTGSFGTKSMHSTMESFRSGELTLRTTQFLEELRKNPTLKLMRDELISLLQDSLDKIGIPPETRGIPDNILHSKLAVLKQRRQTTIQKYPIFPEFRKQCNEHADRLAREKLREQKRSPPPTSAAPRSGMPPRPGSGSNPNVSSAGGSPSRPGPPAAARQMSAPSTPTRQPHQTASGSPARLIQSQPIPSQQLPPRAAPRTQSPQRTGQSGSSLEFTSTQWDSDEEEETEEDDDDSQPAFQRVPRVQSRPPPVTAGHGRPSQHPSPAPRQTPQSRTAAALQDDDDDDWDDSDISEMDLEDQIVGRSSTAPQPIRVQSSPARNAGMGTSPARTGPVMVQPRGQNVAALASSIEMQLAGRKDDKKPTGAIDVMGSSPPKKKIEVLDDFNSDSEWDVSPFEEDQPAKTAPKKGPTPVRGSHASETTNTYGSSVWGSSSKGASTVPAPGGQGSQGRASRGSFVSVTDVSSDEELDLDNI